MIMINLSLLVIINSLICLGLYKSFAFEYNQDGDPDNDSKAIFWFWGYWLTKWPVRLAKPFGGCLTCMASVFSLVPYWVWYCELNFTPFNVVFYPFYILAVAGANSILYKIIEE